MKLSTLEKRVKDQMKAQRKATMKKIKDWNKYAIGTKIKIKLPK